MKRRTKQGLDSKQQKKKRRYNSTFPNLQKQTIQI